MIDLLDGYEVPDGHYDELRDHTGRPRLWWPAFARSAPQLDAASLTRAQAHVEKQIRDSTITHSVYASDGRTRPWMLDVLPFVITAAEWAPLADGVRRYARLLNAVAQDLYGPQHLLRERIVPAAAVFAHPGFLRAAHSVAAPGGVHLHQVAFDVTRTPDGRWRIGGVRAQTPAGAGYALENRATILRLFPGAFRDLHTRAITPYFATLRAALARHAPCEEGSPQIVVLTPGPYSGRYFEHAYLARYFGFPLVEGADLTVRHDRLFLKTVSGLRQVHGVVRQLADHYCDPLELRADSALGIPGLVQSWRAGRVLLANAPGCGLLESPELAPYLPAACARLLGERLDDGPAPGRGDGESLRSGSYAPVWHDGRMEGRAVLLRLFAVADGRGDYVVMPGGLTRIAAPHEGAVTKGSGGSKDTWVLSAAPLAPHHSEGPIGPTSADRIRGNGAVTSRAAEHLFWLGRYVERADTAARLLRTSLIRLSDPSSSSLLPPVLLRVCVANGLLDADDVESDTSAAALSPRLVQNIFELESRQSLGFDVKQAVRVAGAIRDRLSSDNWRLLNQLFGLVSTTQPVDLHDALALLERCLVSLAATAGIEIAHMRRDQAWHFLSVGRHLERLTSVATMFASVTRAERVDPEVLEWLLDVSDSLVTFRSRYHSAPEWPAVVELLLADAYNPRSLAFQVSRISRQLSRLPGGGTLDVVAEVSRLEDAAGGCNRGQPPLVSTGTWIDTLLGDCERVAAHLSDALTAKYFSHAYELPHVTGAGV